MTLNEGPGEVNLTNRHADYRTLDTEDVSNLMSLVQINGRTMGRVLWYPTQAKIRLEWGTQPLLLVQGLGVKAAAS